MRHAIVRASERYGVVLTEEEFHTLIGQIQAKKSLCIKKFHTHETHAVKTASGVTLIALYVPRHNMIATFLPLEAITPRGVKSKHMQETRPCTPKPRHMDGVAHQKNLRRIRAKDNRREKGQRAAKHAPAICADDY